MGELSHPSNKMSFLGVYKLIKLPVTMPSIRKLNIAQYISKYKTNHIDYA